MVYWFSLASHPVIMDANMKYVLPSLTIAGASTRFPPSSFHPYTLVVGVKKSSERATMRSPYSRCSQSAPEMQDRGYRSGKGTHIFGQQVPFAVIVLE